MLEQPGRPGPASPADEYRKVLLVMEMALEPPEIKFETVSCSTGVETIEKARGASR